MRTGAKQQKVELLKKQVSVLKTAHRKIEKLYDLPPYTMGVLPNFVNRLQEKHFDYSTTGSESRGATRWFITQLCWFMLVYNPVENQLVISQSSHSYN